MAPWVWAFMESAAGATEIFDLRERFDQMFAVQRPSWPQCVYFTSFQIGHKVPPLLLLLESNNFQKDQFSR